MSTKDAAVSGFARGAAPYVVGGAVLLALLGGLQAKYNLTGKAGDVKTAADGAIVTEYTLKQFHYDDKAVQGHIATGIISPVAEEDRDKVYAAFGSTDINIASEAEFADFAKDPTAYMNAYAAKEGWF